MAGKVDRQEEIKVEVVTLLIEGETVKEKRKKKQIKQKP